MSYPIWVTGAAMGGRGLTGCVITTEASGRAIPLSHLWPNFRKGEKRYQTTDAIRMVIGGIPQTLEEFAVSTQEA